MTRLRRRPTGAALQELVLGAKHDLALAKVISPLYPMRTEAHEKYKKAEED